MNQQIEDENENKMDDRTRDFLNNLYGEKEKHKQHRHELVKHKLMFVIGLFSIGSLKTVGNNIAIDFSSLLYFVPFVAIAYDVYIFSEDFKVKRIGEFILEECVHKCPDEAAWETWLTEGKHRESIALVASLTLSLLVITACASLLYPITDIKIFELWLATCGSLLVIVFGYSYYRRWKLLNNKKETKSNPPKPMEGTSKVEHADAAKESPNKAN